MAYFCKLCVAERGFPLESEIGLLPQTPAEYLAHLDAAHGTAFSINAAKQMEAAGIRSAPLKELPAITECSLCMGALELEQQVTIIRIDNADKGPAFAEFAAEEFPCHYECVQMAYVGMAIDAAIRDRSLSLAFQRSRKR